MCLTSCAKYYGIPLGDFLSVSMCSTERSEDTRGMNCTDFRLLINSCSLYDVASHFGKFSRFKLLNKEVSEVAKHIGRGVPSH